MGRVRLYSRKNKTKRLKDEITSNDGYGLNDGKQPNTY